MQNNTQPLKKTLNLLSSRVSKMNLKREQRLERLQNTKTHIFLQPRVISLLDENVPFQVLSRVLMFLDLKELFIFKNTNQKARQSIRQFFECISFKAKIVVYDLQDYQKNAQFHSHAYRKMKLQYCDLEQLNRDIFNLDSRFNYDIFNVLQTGLIANKYLVANSQSIIKIIQEKGIETAFSYCFNYRLLPLKQMPKRKQEGYQLNLKKDLTNLLTLIYECQYFLSIFDNERQQYKQKMKMVSQYLHWKSFEKIKPTVLSQIKMQTILKNKTFFELSSKNQLTNIVSFLDPYDIQNLRKSSRSINILVTKIISEQQPHIIELNQILDKDFHNNWVIDPDLVELYSHFNLFLKISGGFLPLQDYKLSQIGKDLIRVLQAIPYKRDIVKVNYNNYEIRDSIDTLKQKKLSPIKQFLKENPYNKFRSDINQGAIQEVSLLILLLYKYLELLVIVGERSLNIDLIKVHTNQFYKTLYQNKLQKLYYQKVTGDQTTQIYPIYEKKYYKFIKHFYQSKS